jgi:hypothetical protein
MLLATVASTGAALAFAGCGDDTGNTATTDSGAEAGPDVTTQDTGARDSSMADRAAADTGNAGNDGASCVGYDASGLDPASVEAGFYAVWQVYRCSGCHQKTSQKVDDAGNGIVLSGNNDGIGDSGMVFPPNLTSDPTTGLGCWTNDQVTNAFLHGTDMDGGKLCPTMPKFGNALTLADGAARPGTPMDAATAAQIVDFLRSLPVAQNQVMDTMCPMMGDAGADAGEDGGDAASVDSGGDTSSMDAADSSTE